MPPVTTDTTREWINDAARERFDRFGPARTAVEGVAAAGKPSRATVYRGVTGGRDEPILAVLMRDLRRFLDRLAGRLRGERSVPEAIVMDGDAGGSRRFPRAHVVPAVAAP